MFAGHQPVNVCLDSSHLLTYYPMLVVMRPFTGTCPVQFFFPEGLGVLNSWAACKQP